MTPSADALAGRVHVPGGGIQPADWVEGLARGLAVLECFDTERQRLNATQTAQRCGLNRAAARRHLLTLAELGYLEREGGVFWLGPRVLRLAGSYLASARLPRLVQSELDGLAERTGLAASAVLLDRAEVVVIARSQMGPARTDGGAAGWRAHGLHLGARLPAHATSTGRVWLADLTPEALDAWLDIHPLRRLTPSTLTDAQAWRAELDRVRRQDHAWAVNEHELGVQALAVPVRDAAGRLVLAINVVETGKHSAEDAAAGRLWLTLLQRSAQALRGVL